MAEDPKLTLLGKKIAHQEVALPCWNDFCQLTSGGCGTQPLLKCLFTHEGCLVHVAMQAPLHASKHEPLLFESGFRLPSVVAMGGKQQSY